MLLWLFLSGGSTSNENTASSTNLTTIYIIIGCVCFAIVFIICLVVFIRAPSRKYQSDDSQQLKLGSVDNYSASVAMTELSPQRKHVGQQNESASGATSPEVNKNDLGPHIIF